MSASPPRMPKLIAHRGASGCAPENTLAAIDIAASQAAQWIEIDVNVSRDGVAVLHHDDDLQRCSNGTGLVIEHTLEQLQQLDCGAWFDHTFSGEKIATLDACLARCLELGLGVNLEIKPTSGWELPCTEAIIATLQRQATLPPLILSSFSLVALRAAFELAPQLPRAALFVVLPPDWQDTVNSLQACNVHLHANSLLTSQDISALHANGLGIYCYTVNDPGQAEATFALGVDGVFTNYPERLARG